MIRSILSVVYPDVRNAAEQDLRAMLARARLTVSESGDSELRLLRRACDTAFAFIESHVADPDITDEMVRKYADYQEARAALEGRK